MAQFASSEKCFQAFPEKFQLQFQDKLTITTKHLLQRFVCAHKAERETRRRVRFGFGFGLELRLLRVLASPTA